MNKNELRAVVEKAQNGEKTAFEKLYKEFHEKLYFFVLKNVGDKHTAEDHRGQLFGFNGGNRVAERA